jgi:U3 small nucleolar RNA-associated protein 10
MLQENMSADSITSINMKNIKAFAENFLANPNKHVEWLANSGSGTRFSRTVFLLVVLQALVPSEGMVVFAVML